ncbi:DUF4189 domain-containing protein [Nocardia sp. CDC153]|uniref:DUF4189 domain-containing protein n=1 Tax=Nocardia sp. CDC153 TaxID=3112167 RepID=UPI002DBD81A2|nr:DUF4189 domain-containing protein [Nocardia sp. CDC153]MEC3957245.1 DUF4189 domain-containing protein [Nocardia sp. CDC153]
MTGTAALTAALTLTAGLAATADAAPGGYGTLALSRLRNTAVSGIDTNRVAADAAAIRDCGSYDCEIVLRFTDGCGAVAQGADGTFGWATGASQEEAEQNAVTGLGQSAPPFPDLGSAQPVAAHVVTSACTKNVQ